MGEDAGPVAGGPEVVARVQLLLEAAETINSSLDSSALETTILGEATRLTGADASALLVSRGDVLVAQEALGLSDRLRSRFVVPLETSVFGRALVTGEVLVEDLPSGGAGLMNTPGERRWRTVVVAPLRSHRATYGALSLFFADPRRFSADEKAALRTLAIHAAIALDNRGLMREKERLAVRDGLTDAFNRGYLEVAIDRAGKEVRRNGGEVSILFVDVDGMKDVNDTYGHEAGDRLLVDLAGLLIECSRESDVVARYGGDEFVVLMPRTGVAGALRVTGKVEVAIAARNAAVGEAPHLSASMGAHTAEAEGVDTLLREADRRMYEAKRAQSGRDSRDGPSGQPVD
jgi:diguanylate cyclase (GGDEF)-like protein